jgi:manganese/zinc/iron transport system substrate-binding protein
MLAFLHKPSCHLGLHSNGALRPRMAIHLAWLAVFAMLAAVTGCSDPGSAGGEGGGARTYPYRIVTTCGMVTDIVRNIAGDKPTRSDVRALSEADVVFYVGLMLEGRMADTFVSLAASGKPVYAVTEVLDESKLREPPEFEGHWDPHVWMNVSLWSECAGGVAERLAEFDPANAQYYRENATRYRQELAALDAYVRQTIASIPEGQRMLITAHDAFGYFGDAYGLKVHSPQGISTESEPSVEDVNQLVDLVVRNKIRAIFVESSVNPKGIRAIQQGAEQRGWKLELGGRLFSDAMGAEGTYEGTYIGMMDHNATTIARALGGEAPAAGMQGRLTPAVAEQ